MQYKNQDGTFIKGGEDQDKILSLLYNTIGGRFLLKPLCNPTLSKWIGKFLSCPLSQRLIPSAIEKYQIPMQEYQSESYRCYNDFFTRRIKPEQRPIAEKGLLSPCDAKLSVYPINQHSKWEIKNHEYSIQSLLRCKEVQEKFQGGYCFIFRLTVDDYHRYCYPVSGTKTITKQIKGVLHTVNPIALKHYNIYHENAREATLFHHTPFGIVAQVEVGALCVGKIKNHQRGKAIVQRGTEKGMFEFGGSTIVLLTQKDKVTPLPMFLENTQEGYETIVKYGQSVSL